ncbi:MAG: response regulator [Chthoniobacteraceae bacterium]
MELIFRSEVSTSPMITRVSGRGLGLAIVREHAEKLGGRVSLENRPGQGTSIRITIPIALATFRGILIESGGRQFVVPTMQVERVIRYQASEVQTVENRETLSLGGRTLALVRMDDVLEIMHMEPVKAAERATAMVLGSGEQRVAFAVDAVLDEQEVLVKRLARPLARVRNIAGVTVLGNGQIAPILNVADLLKSAKRAGIARPVQSDAGKKSAVAAPSSPPKVSILVAEDSITSRMLLKGILEAAGYAVQTTVDGMEAYSALREGTYDLVISDVEMPRLNGFDLTARIRADRKLEKLPVILVTALETREDRERGIDAGANAYVVKSNFDQSNLLEIIRRLV